MKIVVPLRLFKIITILVLGCGTVMAQSESAPSNPNVRLGQKALLDGDFKAAAEYLERALPAEAGDPNVMYMLGYAQYHSGNYEKALASFSKVVELRPEDERSYYFKGRLNNMFAVKTDTKLSTAKREELLRASITDYSKGIDLNDQDVKLFQNRGISYRDLGILLGTSGTANYNKEAAVAAYNHSIADFETVLSFFPAERILKPKSKKRRFTGTI